MKFNPCAFDLGSRIKHKNKWDGMMKALWYYHSYRTVAIAMIISVYWHTTHSNYGKGLIKQADKLAIAKRSGEATLFRISVCVFVFFTLLEEPLARHAVSTGGSG